MQSLSPIDNLGGVDVHQSLIAWFLHSKALTITATTSAIGYLTAYTSPDIVQAASAVPQVINFIGTHGPTANMSWADVMAIISGLLVMTNLAIGLHKIGSGIISKIRVWRKKPRSRARR